MKKESGIIWFGAFIVYVAIAGAISFVTAKECSLHPDRCAKIVTTQPH